MPYFGATSNISTEEWWKLVLRETLSSTELLDGCVDAEEIEELFPDFFDFFYNNILNSEEGTIK